MFIDVVHAEASSRDVELVGSESWECGTTVLLSFSLTISVWAGTMPFDVEAPFLGIVSTLVYLGLS